MNFSWPFHLLLQLHVSDQFPAHRHKNIRILGRCQVNLNIFQYQDLIWKSNLLEEDRGGERQRRLLSTLCSQVSKLPSISIDGEVFRFLWASEGYTFMSLYMKILHACISSIREVSSPDCLSNTAQQAVTTAFCCIRTKLKIRCKFLNASFPLTYICHLYANAALLFDLTCASQAVSLTWLGQWWGWASVKSWSTLDCPNVFES